MFPFARATGDRAIVIFLFFDNSWGREKIEKEMLQDLRTKEEVTIE